MTISQDLKSIILYLKNQNIKIDYEEFKFQVQSHPDFPSLLSFSDALTFFNIKNAAVRVPKEEISLLPDHFITILTHDNEEIISYVKMENGNYTCSVKSGFISVDEPEFSQYWDGIILLAEPDSEVKVIKQKKSLFPRIMMTSSVLLLFTVLLFKATNSIDLLFILVTVLGILVSIEVFKQNIGITSKISSKFCSITTTSDCSSILKSKENDSSKINLSNISIIYFCTILIITLSEILQNDISQIYQLMSYGIWLTIPVGIYSIYYQFKVEKKWCPLCLVILVSLLAHLSIVYSKSAFFAPVSYNTLVISTIVILFISGAYFASKKTLVKLNELKEVELKSIRFKGNYELFKKILLSEKDISNTANNDALVLGNPEATLKIHFTTNPNCKFCKSAHSVIEKILAQPNLDVCIYLRFNEDIPDSNDDTKYIHRVFINHYLKNGPKAFLSALHEWFENKNILEFRQKHGEISLLEYTPIDEVLKSHFQWTKENNVVFTPCIIVGSKFFPTTFYNTEDIQLFLNDLAQDDF